MGKKITERKAQLARFAFFTVPVTGMIMAALGVAYQYSTNNNLTNSLFMPNTDNPNLPSPFNPFNRDFSFFNFKGKEYSTVHTDTGMYFPDPGPSWKKWEDQKSE